MDPITAALVNLVIGLVISGVTTLAQQALAPKSGSQKQLPGLRGQYSTGGTVPMTIVLGTYGVPGQLEYSNTWGTSGETPNAYLVDVISIADYRITSVSALWIDSKSVTINDGSPSARGYAVPEFETGGKNYAWHKLYTGNQGTADAYLLDKFGGDSKRPWLSDMAGAGISYAVQTARISEELWTDFPRYMYQVQGAPVFDIRLSTAAGGSGSQVWGAFATYTFSDNPIVLAMNVLMGLHDAAGNHIWGGHATLAQFDYANVAAAMNRCDDAIALVEGGTERRYRAGIEVSLNERPADVARELLIASNTRITFTRGKYYFLTDVPETADGSFTDGDLLIDEPIDFSQFPNSDETINGLTGTFLAPQLAWEQDETAPYYRDDLEAIDGQANRQKLDLRCVFSGTQAQRIIKAVVEEGRRFKRVVVPLPPTYDQYRPLQVLAWTSDEFQYDGKLWLIISKTVDEWGKVWFALQEIDPADFDWDPETDQTALTFASTEESVVPTQAIAGWNVQPWTDNRRPGIHLEWQGALDDIRATQVQIRLSGETGHFFNREYPYEQEEAEQHIYISGDPLLRDTAYEVRARFLPFDGSGRRTLWSNQDPLDGSDGPWFAVTTPDVGIAPEDLGPTLQAMNDFFSLSIRDINELMMLATSVGADQDLANYSDKQFVLNQIAVKVEEAAVEITASYTEAILLLAGDVAAFADYAEAVETLYGDVATSVLFRMSSYASPGGGWSRVGLESRATMGDVWASAAIFMESKTDGTSRIVLKGGSTYILDSLGNILAAFGSDGGLVYARIPVLSSDKIDVANLFAQDAAVQGELTVGSSILIDGPNGRIVVSD